MRRVIVAAALTVAVSGCGGSSTPPTPVPTGLTITGNDGVLFLGQTYTFTATLQLSNGTTSVVSGTWGSDAPSVATAQASTGQVQVLGIGEATIFVDAQGLRGTRRIRTTVNYQGEMEGRLRQTACSQTGIFLQLDPRPCTEFPNGTVFAFSATFVQNGESVTATINLGSVDEPFLSDPVTATVNGAGELRFTSEHREDDVVFIGEWVLRPSGTTMIGGSAVWRVRVVGQTGTWEIRGELQPRPIARTLDAVPALDAVTIRDAIRGFTR